MAETPAFTGLEGERAVLGLVAVEVTLAEDVGGEEAVVVGVPVRGLKIRAKELAA